MSNFHLDLMFTALAVLCALTGAAFDLKSRRIPNRLTLPCMVAGLLLHLTLGGLMGFALAAAAGLIAGTIFVVFWIAGGMGAGDVKLMTAVACIAGFPHVAWLLILTALAGGVMAIGLALWKGRLRDTVLNMAALAVHHRFEGLKPHPHFNVRNALTLRLPYGLAIAAGSLVTLCMAVRR